MRTRVANRSSIGVVVIGRNEGARLHRCLRCLTGQVRSIVYVDSGSTDGSQVVAQSLGVEVLALDPSRVFTAARARNAGFARLLAHVPELAYVQFIDGDCEMAPGWLERAALALDEHSEVAIVCGRRRERYPNASRYNLLCDMEWNTPIGEAGACGGDALIRRDAFERVGGFNATMIAGEEPELCVRIRKHGWKILRINAEMTIHDAAMTELSQWWRRAKRAGHAYAEGAFLHGAGPWRHNVSQLRSIVVWGLAIPILAVFGSLLATTTTAASASIGSGFAMYGILLVRVYRHRRACGDTHRPALVYAAYTVLGKLPMLAGAFSFWTALACGKHNTLIEYK